MHDPHIPDPLARPDDVAQSRLGPREPTHPVEDPGAAASEGTVEQLRAFADGELDELTVAGRYELRRVLGSGGMATVYEAYDRVLARRVAIKVLADVHAGEPLLLARFLAEARMTARLRDPNIVHMIDFGTTRSGIIYLTMELLRGEDLRRKLRREGRLSWAEARAALLDICAGLETAHAAGIVHRDLKPSNCFWTTGDDGELGELRILDFGIATACDEGPDRLTQSGRILGTPDYMSPEQIRGEVVDQRCDIYSLGVVLGEMLTGRVPYEAKTREAMLAAHLYEPTPRLAELAPEGLRLPAGLEQIYARALAKDPADRFANVRSFANALRAVGKRGAVWTTREHGRYRWTVPAVAATLAFVAGVGGGLGFRAEAASTPELAPVRASGAGLESRPGHTTRLAPGGTLIPLVPPEDPRRPAREAVFADTVPTRSAPPRPVFAELSGRPEPVPGPEPSAVLDASAEDRVGPAEPGPELLEVRPSERPALLLDGLVGPRPDEPPLLLE